MLCIKVNLVWSQYCNKITVLLISSTCSFIRVRQTSYKEKKLARSFNFMFDYIDEVLPINNSEFGDFVDPVDLEIKDTTDTVRSASYIDLNLKINSEGWSRMALYHNRDDINFPIMKFLFICSNIRATPANGVCISWLIQLSRACGSYHDYLDRRLLLTRKLLNQGFLVVKLKSSLQFMASDYPFGIFKLFFRSVSVAIMT